MAKLKFVKGVDELKFNIENARKSILTSANKELHKIGRDIYAESKANMADAGLIYTGEAIDSLYVTVPIKTKNGYSLEVGANSLTAVYHHEGWKGQKIGRKVFEKIEDWVINKLNVTPEESYIVTYTIAMNLAMSGHKAEPFMQEAIDKYANKIKPSIAAKIKNGLKKLFRKRS